MRIRILHQCLFGWHSTDDHWGQAHQYEANHVLAGNKIEVIFPCIGGHAQENCLHDQNMDHHHGIVSGDKCLEIWTLKAL
eukprot:5857119-Amphidinium_carterae.1